MENSLDELYEEWLEAKVKVMKETIEVQKGLSVAKEVSRVLASQERLEDAARTEENPLVQLKLSEGIKSNSEFLLGVAGVYDSKQGAVVNPMQQVGGPQQETKAIDYVEAINFEEDDF